VVKNREEIRERGRTVSAVDLAAKGRRGCASRGPPHQRKKRSRPLSISPPEGEEVAPRQRERRPCTARGEEAHTV
jgi:hypothetical protein